MTWPQTCSAVVKCVYVAFSRARFFIEILLATTDYDRFYFLMVAEAKKVRREANDGGDGAASPLSHK